MNDQEMFGTGGGGLPSESAQGWTLPPPPPPAGTESPGGGRGRRGRVAIASVVAAAVLFASGFGVGWTAARGAPSVAPAASPGVSSSLNVSAIATAVEPAVVDINTFIDSRFLGAPISGFPLPGGSRPLGAGTGMVLTPSGLVLTNNHVIEEATSIRVTIPGRSGTYAARVVGANPTDDVALLQIEGVSGLATVTAGSSSTLTVGEGVVAIGNAFGQGGTPSVTSGAVAALDRAITVSGALSGAEHLQGLIQMSASVSPGDSGGPLVDAAGRVVGMITAGATSGPGQAVAPVGFAIPIDHALSIVGQIRSGNTAGGIILGVPGFLGVQVSPSETAQAGAQGTTGALVVGVVSGTPAAAAGIVQGDVITAIDGRRITSSASLGPAIRAHAPGQTIRVTWVGSGGTHTATVRLAAGPAA